MTATEKKFLKWADAVRALAENREDVSVCAVAGLSVANYQKTIYAIKGVGIKIVRKRGRYRLVMPLADALAILEKKSAPEPKPVFSVKKKKRRYPSKYVKKGFEIVPVCEDMPWWGIITRREPIDCRLG